MEKNEVHPYRDHRFWIKEKGAFGITEHRLEEIAFYYIESGQLAVYVEEVKHKLSAGDALLIPPGLCFREEKWGDKHVEYSILGLNPLLFEGKGYRRFMQPLMTKNKDYVLKLSITGNEADKWQRNTLELLSKMISCQANQDYESWELEFHGYVFILWNTIFHNYYAKFPAISSLQSHYRRLAASIEYIHGHYNEMLSLDTLAKMAFLSPSAYCNYFKKVFGETPIGYQNRYRIRMSRLLLISSDDKISNIAHKCGYNSLSHFNREFKRYMSCTPSQYRRNTK